MKKLVLLLAILIALGIGARHTKAQTWRTDAGVIVVEDRILSPYQKQIVFICTKSITEAATVQFETMTLDGIINRYTPMSFPSGVKRGQIIPLWNGDFNQFETSPWLRFDVIVASNGTNYYTVHSVPVNQAEQYKEPMITGITETKISSNTYTYSLEGNFDRYSDTNIVINSNVLISPKGIVFGAGTMQFTTSNVTKSNFPTGKFLLTVCQNGQCDSMVGRHR